MPSPPASQRTSPPAVQSSFSTLQQDRQPFERIRHRHLMAHAADDAPPVAVRWHYAVDVPKRRPTTADKMRTTSQAGAAAGGQGTVTERAATDTAAQPTKTTSTAAAQVKVADKYVSFSQRDSRALEQAFQDSLSRAKTRAAAGGSQDAEERPTSAGTKVAVNEDHLFEVDIEERELGPVYWRGPVYAVRRGTWHVAEGSTLKPCDENLATQVEDGYLKVKPWKESVSEETTEAATDESEKKEAGDVAPSLSSADKLLNVSDRSRSLATPESTSARKSTSPSKAAADLARKASLERRKDPQRTAIRPLFGSYAGKYVLYTSKTTAWLLSDDLYGKISASFFQSVTRGVHMGGTKLMRGFTDAKEKDKVKGAAKDKDKSSEKLDKADKADKEKEQVHAEVADVAAALPGLATDSRTAKEADVGTGAVPTADYDEGENPNRPIEHLILCVHGIGQKLSERLDSVNFIHDVNVLRRTFKQTYNHSKELQMLGPGTSGPPPESKGLNCGVQVLPVEWRQTIRFGMASEAEDGAARGEQDLAQGVPEEEEAEEHATLQDITVEGVQTIRHLISDALLDILLFYQPSYREKIIKAVASELNRVYHLFRERNPDFNGKVSIFGHSLGSAIAFDIVCRQPTDAMLQREKAHQDALLAFDVDNLYCVGSPVGLFQMLRGKEIRARAMLETETVPMTPFPSTASRHADPFEQSTSGNSNASDAHPASFPKVGNLFNIFHPSDPVAYRLEPLVSKHAAKLKPHPIPYTKAGFRQQLVGLSSIPQRALEGASSYWGALRSSITNSIVSRSLGYSDLAGASSQQQQATEQEAEAARQRQHAADKARVQGAMAKQHEETLFASFDKAFGATATEQAQRRTLEGERRLRQLNARGQRIDYAIQEDLIGSSYISALHSHLAYWGDVDVAHFLMSRLYTDGEEATESDAS